MAVERTTALPVDVCVDVDMCGGIAGMDMKSCSCCVDMQCVDECADVWGGC